MPDTRLILVGGFLGAGKTTLLWEAARLLQERNLRVGLITNDQAPDLVDTAFLSLTYPDVKEVSGSCFCCNFQGLLDAVTSLRAEVEADVLLAEPVGSCTDLSATILQPLKERMTRSLKLSPLSVLVDPDRLNLLYSRSERGLHSSALYIFRKQLEEADMIVISKADLKSRRELSELEKKVRSFNPRAEVHTLSARTGQGVEEWLDEVLTRSDSGRTIADVDYDIYAEGEAVLGWLNSLIELKGKETNWTEYTRKLLRELGETFDSRDAVVGHVKLLVQHDGRSVTGNLTGTTDTLSVRGPALVSESAQLTLNARVQMAPEDLEEVVRAALEKTGSPEITAVPRTWQCFSPARPEPTHRYGHIVR